MNWLINSYIILNVYKNFSFGRGETHTYCAVKRGGGSSCGVDRKIETKAFICRVRKWGEWGSFLQWGQWGSLQLCSKHLQCRCSTGPSRLPLHNFWDFNHENATHQTRTSSTLPNRYYFYHSLPLIFFNN